MLVSLGREMKEGGNFNWAVSSKADPATTTSYLAYAQ